MINAAYCQDVNCFISESKQWVFLGSPPSQDWKANRGTKAEWYLWVMDKPLKREGSWEKGVGSFSELLWIPSFPLSFQKATNLWVACGDNMLTFCPQISLPYPLKELSSAADFESIIAGLSQLGTSLPNLDFLPWDALTHIHFHLKGYDFFGRNQQFPLHARLVLWH